MGRLNTYEQAVKERSGFISSKLAAKIVFEARFSSFSMRCWSCLRKIMKGAYITHFALKQGYMGKLPEAVFWCSVDCRKNLESNGVL